MMKCIFDQLESRTLHLVFNKFIRPHLKYGDLVFRFPSIQNNLKSSKSDVEHDSFVLNPFWKSLFKIAKVKSDNACLRMTFGLRSSKVAHFVSTDTITLTASLKLFSALHGKAGKAFDWGLLID